MLTYEKSPAAGGTAEPGGYERSRVSYKEQFPRCNLHGLNLVHALPPRCPLAEWDRMGALERLQARGWHLIAPGLDEDTTAGLASLEEFETCFRCTALKSPWVRRLRAEALRAAERADGSPAVTPPIADSAPPSAGPVAIRSRRLPVRRLAVRR